MTGPARSSDSTGPAGSLRRILVLDDASDLAAVDGEALRRFTDVVLLFWASPETRGRLAAAGDAALHGLADVVGDRERWEQRAFALSDRVCGAGPTYRGLPWRTLIAEELFRECLSVQLALDLTDFCRQRGDGGGRGDPAIEVRAAEPLAGLVAAVARDAGLAAVTVRPPLGAGSPAARTSLLRRLLRRFDHARLAGNWRVQAWNLAAELDRGYAWRCRPRLRRPPPAVDPGGVSFVSSYLNNSRILAACQTAMPAPVSWLVLNHGARRGAGTPGPVWWLWRFSPTGAGPEAAADSAPAVASGDRREERALRAWLDRSPAWRYWRSAGHRSLVRLTRAWEHYLDRARPALVVMASQWGLEGWLTRVARRRGIPVVQLLHGVLGGYFYTGRPIVSDLLVVWGEFWRQLWPEPERRHIRVFNPGGVVTERVRRRSSSGRPRLTYFSWPFDRIPFYNGAELLDGFIDLFDRLIAAGACELTVRAHPLENLSDLERRWRRRRGHLPAGLRFSQQEPLAKVVATTDLAVLFRSTVLLDCLASGVPLVMPGWIDDGLAGALEGLPGVHRADGFADLEATVAAWLAHPPRTVAETGRLLRPAGEGLAELRALLAELSAGRTAAAAASASPP